MVGCSRVDTRQCITGVFGRVMVDSGGLRTSPSLVEIALEKSGWILRGDDSLGGGLVTATLIRLVMTISTAASCSGEKGSGW